MELKPYQKKVLSDLESYLEYVQAYKRIDEAFNREKQVQSWNRKKKEALIFDERNKLSNLAECQNETHYKNYKGL